MSHTSSANKAASEQPRLVKAQKVYDYLRSRIQDGTYGPGDRIVIDRVAAELNVSISPVREAIRQLEAAGFLQTIPYCGAVVQLLNDSDFGETFWAMSFLDGGATFLAASQMSPQDIQKLENINNEMRKALNDFDFEQIGVLNRKFHETIYERSGNAYLIDSLQQTWQRIDQIRKSFFTLIPQRIKSSIAEHDEMIRLLKENAPPQEVEAFSRRHKLESLNAIKNRMKNERK